MVYHSQQLVFQMITHTAYQALEGFEENILSMAKTAQVKHLDETGVCHQSYVVA